MSKKLIVPTFLFFIALITLACWQLTPKEKPGFNLTGLPMKISVNYWPGQYWISIAHKKGWFKQAKLNVELIEAKKDYFASLQEMVDGKIDGNNFSLFDLIKFNIKGSDLVMIFQADDSFGGDVIVAKSSLKTIQDLKGKKIGVTQNTYLEYILDIVLEKKQVGLNEVKIVDMLGEKASDAFIKGTVDAIVTWEPVVTTAIKKGHGHKLFDTSEIPGISPSGFAFHRSFIEARTGDVHAFVEVWNKTINFIKENPKEAFGIIAEAYKTTPREAQAFAQTIRIQNLQENLTAFTFAAGFHSLHGVSRKINNFMIKKKETINQLDSTKFIESLFIRHLDQRLKK